MIGDVQRESIEKVRKMYYVENMTKQEIAEKLGYTIATVIRYINLGNRLVGESKSKPKKTWKKNIEKPLTYKQIKAKS